MCGGKMHKVSDVQALSDKLIPYLRATLDNPTLGLASPLVQLQGGYETSSYRFELDGAPEELSRPLVLRLYPQFRGTGSAIWESAVQNGLAGQGYPVAQAHVLCTDMAVLGGAFFIMDHLPGRPLAVAPPDSVPGLLGQTHAELHNIDPAPLMETLREKGIDDDGYRLESRFHWLEGKGRELPWLRQAVDWLLDNRPPEPERLSVCHGDYHPLNILYADGKVTGVLDWGGFSIADPAYDVGNTVVLITIALKHLAASMDGLPPIDVDLMAELYLASYRAHRPLDSTNLDYYRVRRCVMSLAQGAEGQKVWQHPLIVRDLLADIHEVTGIQVSMPS
jgi:aminoglycoside phosphotransferase (APT) family kinase protein